MVKHLGGKIVKLYCDSRLVVGQVDGEFEARDGRMKSYLERIKGVLSLFESFQVQQVPRGQNAHADSLAMLATSLDSKLPRMVIVEDLLTPSLTSISTVRVHNIRVGPRWMDPIIDFLQQGVLPEDGTVAEKVQRSAPRYWLSEEQKLYRRSYAGLYLLCVHPEAVEPLLEELHEGLCGSHTGGRSLAHRAMTQGYWWPNMQKTSQEYAKKCDQCQRYAPNIYQLGGTLNPLSSPWPFAKWDLDIVGPFPRAIGNKRWLIVGTDYFTKWVEAEPLANIRDVDAKKFIWKNIITRFGVPHTLISDNGLQFDSKAFRRMHDCLNTIEERREVASVKMGSYQQKLKQTYDEGVRSRPLVPGDLVLRKVVGTARNLAWGKLGPNWEGPYKITSLAGVGAYRLEDLDGRMRKRK
ncbi:uncharacterized protein LOC142629669 [Castanea sativa]|uniref:uncharacterized protein LOC142629669 n=1 Tax=Castanea sativa TaxID=21020 RepID=UPI003F649A45